ncbi:hypothetical protein JOC75_001006 [Metabacillus crassostreae]|uniref:hypothetical protein n=1 Tax=Metabacillus crassostreae TaxID=929098 RepID=UPI00195DD81D|nr:hypothetical protein [Metabacillus crassostreae]MBM7603036.1 hypothetical protein [Metabacillus crassostreae]
MNNTTQLIMLFLSIIFVLVLYRKSKEEEQLLLLKLFGFTFLGAFMLDINGLKLPLGFAIFLLFFRSPRVNAKTKNSAAYLGLVIFMLVVFIPKIENMIYERTQHVELLDTNFYSGSLVEEMKHLKNQLNMDDNRIEIHDLDLTINQDGTYENLRLQLEEQNYEDTVNYNIDLSHDRKNLEVKRFKVKSEEYVNDNTFTEAELVLGNLDLITNSMLNFEGEAYTQLKTDGQRVSYEVRENRNFQISTAGKNKVENSQLPVRTIFVDVCHSNELDELRNPLKCEYKERFLLDMLPNELELTDSTVLDVARQVSSEIDEWLVKHTGDSIAYEKNGEFVLIEDGKEEKVQESEYIMALKETPRTTITHNEQNNIWDVTIENPYGNAPHKCEFMLNGETREVHELKFR